MRLPVTTYGLLPKILRKLRKVLPQDHFLRRVRGVIHIGANSGQERDLYARYGLEVLWIEPIPAVFETLRSNLKNFPKQRAFQRLISDQDRCSYTLHISNNGGASSSIFELAAHREMWPEVRFTESIEIEGVTLPSFLGEEGIDVRGFDALVLDTQGSELLILKGATDILERFRYIKSEVADFESYAGGCQLPELDAFMAKHGFRQQSRYTFAESLKGQKYYEVLYRRLL